MFTARAHIGQLNIAPLSGVILTIVLIVMVIFSMQFVRRSGLFEIFYWSHLLFIVFYVLLIIHARYYWCWFIGPGAIYFIEKAYYLFKRCSPRKGRTFVHSATIEEANVIKLNIYRPAHFYFRPSDYVFLKIPQIARFEWHPFTISSAPEDTKLLTVHIKSAGNWTNQVIDRYKSFSGGTLSNSDPEAPTERIYLDGPYASSTRYIFNSSHAILIAAGIGKLTISDCLKS
jgi:predicted ferric reductase